MRLEILIGITVRSNGTVNVTGRGYSVYQEQSDPVTPADQRLGVTIAGLLAAPPASTPAPPSDTLDPASDVAPDWQPSQPSREGPPVAAPAPGPKPAIVAMLAALGIEHQAATLILATHPEARVTSVANWIMKKKSREPVGDPQALLLACLSKPA